MVIPRYDDVHPYIPHDYHDYYRFRVDDPGLQGTSPRRSIQGIRQLKLSYVTGSKSGDGTKDTAGRGHYATQPKIGTYTSRSCE